MLPTRWSAFEQTAQSSSGNCDSVVFSIADHAILVQDDKGNQMFEVTMG